MRHLRRALVVLLAAASVTSLAALPAGAQAGGSGQTLYGLTTGNRIVTFTTGFAALASNDVAVTGLSAGESLIGIDRRPKTGAIYGVGKLGSAGNLYTVDPATGAASLVAPLVTAPTVPGGPRTPIALSGTEFGFDFNPAADALRIVSDTGQNLRVIPSDRMPAAIALLTGDTFTDGTLNVGGTTATGVSGAAYTNNDNDPATGTTLYDLDTRRDLLVKQDPPNSGALVGVGSLRFPAGGISGFDIVSAGGVDTAYAALTLDGFPYTFLARVDLATGAAQVSSLAAFPRTLRGLAA